MGQCFGRNNSIEPSSANSEELNKNGNIEHQMLTKSRSCTDIFTLILMILFFTGLIFLIGYCIAYGDIYRVINGYDDCGNVCGRTNEKLVQSLSSCQHVDMSTRRLLVITPEAGSGMEISKIHRQCAESCDNTNYREFFNRCIPNKSATVVNSFFSKTGLPDFFEEVNEDFHLCWKEILYLSGTAFAFSIIMLILFRYMAGFIVWLILIGVTVATIIGASFLWIRWHIEKKKLDEINVESRDNLSQRNVYTFLTCAIIATIVTFIIILIIFVMRKRIRLVVQLFKEAGKAIANMPILLFEPILTFISLFIAICSWIYFSIWIESSGFLESETNQSLYLKKNIVMKLTRWYNLFAMFWITQFIIGCQHIIIAGAVSKWFFTRNKKKLDFPVLKSFKYLIVYHLGSVALGSLLIAIVQMLRAILQFIQNKLKRYDNPVVVCILRCCSCCLYLFEKTLKYLSRNAYIEIAIYGEGFCKSGKRAFTVLTSNALRVIAINSVGDFVLFLGKVFVVIATVLIGFELVQKKEGVQHVWVMLAIAGVIAYLTSHCFICIYEMAIDTIFICFCEDCKENDGVSKPYYMSRGLMEFVQSTKKSINNATEEFDTQAWSSK